MTDVAITEFEEIDPDELHLVGKGANGFKALLAKSADDEVRAVLDTIEEIVNKADDDAPKKDCATCDGSGKIMNGNRKCPKCLGTGVAPKVGQTTKELFEAAKEAGVAASGADTPAADICPTCHGNGKIVNAKQGATEATDTCPDCNGTGKDSKMQPDENLKAVDGDPGKITVGAGGRETVDKAIADYDELVKAKYKQADRDKMASGGQAMPDGAYPIKDAEDLGNAIHAVGRGGASHNTIRQHIMGRAKALGMSSQIPDNWQSDGSLGKELVEKDGMISGMNPMVAATAVPVPGEDDCDDDPAKPGSPEWEAHDAEVATNAANALLEAAEFIRHFANRETIEVAAGEGNDVFDAWDAEMALHRVTEAIGVMATMAFHEGVEAQKSLFSSVISSADSVLAVIDNSDNDAMTKAGKRLSTKSVSALTAARDHLTSLLGDDDPAKSKDDDAEKSQEDILNMDKDELSELVAATVAKAVEAVKSQDVGNTESIANAKMANAKNKKKMPKAENTDLEDEADQGDGDSASGTNQATGAAKAELTPEEIEANEALEVAKAAKKDAKKAQKQAAGNAAVAKAIEEAVTKATNAVDDLKEQLAVATKATEDRLATVEKMAAPTSIVKTRPQGAEIQAAERDTKELRIATLEREARETSDPAVRAGNREIIKELRTELTAKN